MSITYQIPGGPTVNVPEDGTEYDLAGYGVLNQSEEIPEPEPSGTDDWPRIARRRRSR